MDTSKFSIHAKNKKALNCGLCGKRCIKGDASKYYHDSEDNKLIVFKHFYCKECYDRITCDGLLSIQPIKGE